MFQQLAVKQQGAYRCTDLREMCIMHHYSKSSNRFSSGTMRQASWRGENSKCGGYTSLMAAMALASVEAAVCESTHM